MVNCVLRAYFVKMEPFDTDRFITEINNRPATWNALLPEYSNKVLKRNAWDELCQIFYNNFNEKTSKEKNLADQLYEIKSPSQNDDAALGNNQDYDFQKPHSPKKSKKNPKREDPQDKLYEALTANLNQSKEANYTILSENPDTLFLVSLAKDFSAIKEEFKLEAKADMKNLIRKYKNMGQSSRTLNENRYQGFQYEHHYGYQSGYQSDIQPQYPSNQSAPRNESVSSLQNLDSNESVTNDSDIISDINYTTEELMRYLEDSDEDLDSFSDGSVEEYQPNYDEGEESEDTEVIANFIASSADRRSEGPSAIPASLSVSNVSDAQWKRDVLPRNEEVVKAKLRRGEQIARQKDNLYTVLKWHDKRDVLMISTCHGDSMSKAPFKRRANTRAEPGSARGSPRHALCKQLRSTGLGKEEEPAIWNPKDPGHKSRNNVHDAWTKIKTKFCEGTGESISVEELKKKKENLMATYRKLNTKVKSSSTSGSGTDDMFKPNWPFYEQMAKFLHGVYKPTTTKSSEVFS
ncbi:hypothetical protein HW555_008184 [Spodoptera exigua]|uniref:MADF domain-containing protein n=1 Tax=Spodoptera exigua TaxID=7107 RepID=A0A835L3R4_SPOEX|nr:hypothetical protein HW555_008184 [Spodoptera exigua]